MLAISSFLTDNTATIDDLLLPALLERLPLHYVL